AQIGGSAGCGEGSGKEPDTHANGGAHETLAAGRHAVAARTRELGDQAVRPQQADATTHTPAYSTPLHRIVRPGTEQVLRQLTVVKAAHGMLATQRGLKQGLI